jgi:hypothetical protein
MATSRDWIRLIGGPAGYHPGSSLAGPLPGGSVMRMLGLLCPVYGSDTPCTSRRASGVASPRRCFWSTSSSGVAW